MVAPQEKAWSEGYAVGKRGKPDTMCPYSKGVIMTAWHEGWQSGYTKRQETTPAVRSVARLTRR